MRLKLALGILSLLALCMLLAPLLAPHGFEAQDISRQLEGPSWDHWLGTDTLGRDLWARVLYGGRVSFAVGILTALLSLIVGSLLGAIAGWRGGWADSILERGMDFFLMMPSLLLAILVTLVVGRGVFGVVLAISIVGWASHARLVRGLVLQGKKALYVDSAVSVGASTSRVIVRHLLPNLMGPLLISLLYQIPASILNESFLSFLGLGIEPPLASWGSLASDGFAAMESYPHLVLIPSLFLFVTMVALQILANSVSPNR